MKFLLLLALVAAVKCECDGTQAFNAFKKLSFDYLKVDSTQLGAAFGCVETNLLANKAFLHRVAEFKDFIDADRPRRVALFTHPENFNVDYFRPICYSFGHKFEVLVDDVVGALASCGAPNTGFLEVYAQKFWTWYCHFTQKQYIGKYFEGFFKLIYHL
jgi:hypothetical protein